MCLQLSQRLKRLPNQHTICYLVGDEGLLFVPASGQLYRLNTTAAFIWCCRDEGLAPLAIATALAGKFGIATSLARRDVVRTLSEWRSLGLLDDTSPEVRKCPADDTQVASNAKEPPSELPTPSAQVTRHYGLLDIQFRIRYPSQETETLIHPLFAHLEMRSGTCQRALEVIFDIVEIADGYLVLKDGIAVSDCTHLLELGPIIQREALLTAYEHTDCLMAVHSAAVCSSNSKCVLLPGAKGSGKSTLTAALIGSGFTYLTDELNLLMSDKRLIRPATVSLGLKRGSWPILAPTYRVLGKLPKYIQEGNREVRYLPPRRGLVPRQETYPVECVIFPRYEAGATTSLEKLSPVEAIYRVTQAGYAVPGCLDSDRVEDLIDWIAQLNCYALRMGDLNAAVREIKALVA